MKRVFVDSGAFFAAISVEDPHHDHAAALFRKAAEEHWRLITTNAVVVETYALLLHRERRGREKAIEFLESVYSEQYRVVRVTPADESQAIALVKRHTDKTYSLCDALSFVVMERLGLTEAIAFDRHFREYGRFTLL